MQNIFKKKNRKQNWLNFHTNKLSLHKKYRVIISCLQQSNHHRLHSHAFCIIQKQEWKELRPFIRKLWNGFDAKVCASTEFYVKLQYLRPSQ
jgi:hypothetical protein